MPNTFSKKINLWDAMIDFDHSNKEGIFAFSIGAVFGWIYHLFLLDFQSWSWAFIIRGFEGVLFAVCSGVCVKIANDFYTIKLKHKIFKHGKKHKTNEADKTDKANVA